MVHLAVLLIALKCEVLLHFMICHSNECNRPAIGAKSMALFQAMAYHET